MSGANELSDLVERGKKDIHAFVKKALRGSAKECGGGSEGERINATISSLLTLALRKTQVEIDVARIRRMIIEENETLLHDVGEDDPNLVLAFAVVVGRVSQIQEFIKAIERVDKTYSEDSASIYRRLDALKEDLYQVEIMSVRMEMDGNGRIILPRLNNAFDQEHRADSVVY